MSEQRVPYDEGLAEIGYIEPEVVEVPDGPPLFRWQHGKPVFQRFEREHADIQWHKAFDGS